MNHTRNISSIKMAKLKVLAPLLDESGECDSLQLGKLHDSSVVRCCKKHCTYVRKLLQVEDKEDMICFSDIVLSWRNLPNMNIINVMAAKKTPVFRTNVDKEDCAPRKARLLPGEEKQQATTEGSVQVDKPMVTKRAR